MLFITIFLFSSCTFDDSEQGDVLINQAESAFLNDDHEKAIQLFTKALDYAPNDPSIYVNRGSCYSNINNLKAALQDYEIAIKLAAKTVNDMNHPALAEIYYNRGLSYAMGGDDSNALLDYEKALKLDPLCIQVKNDLAWLLATCPIESLRNPQRALNLAMEECEKNKWRVAADIDTLAAAYASNGDFTNAIKMQHKAIELLNNNYKIDAYKSRLEFYQNDKIYIDYE